MFGKKSLTQFHPKIKVKKGYFSVNELYKEIIRREHEGYYNIEEALKLGSNTIKNYIWARVSCGQAIPGCLSLACLRDALKQMGEEPFGFHNT